MKAQDIIKHLGLIEHPEGGYYKETYRSEMEGDFEGFNGKRNLGTAIYFLMLGGQSTLPHRIKSDELWFYQYGSSCEIVEIDDEGNERIIRLGADLANGEVLQHVVKAGLWFYSRVKAENDFCLAACHVNPGFDFQDFEIKSN
jgi:predicted cupin superfamily sugar epimerase